MTPLETLKKFWNYHSFRGSQEAIIDSVLKGKDTLAVMPTGGGKSICFQVPALALPGICIVVTPLIALMKDQVTNLKSRGIFALAIHSGMRYPQVKQTLENAAYGNYKFLYLSPERLETSLFSEYLPLLKISLIAVDEAHCISQWGYDFRPSYLKISALREKLGKTPVIALTASATKEVQQDICEKLLFGKDAKRFTQTYERPNLSYSVFNPPSKENKLLEILHNVSGSSIIYCRSRKRTKEVALFLQSNHIAADYYHAGLDTEVRNQKQDDWLRNNIRVICCTNAFGMGIDKPDVRTVIHTDIPDALEFYYQEAGRAGRDGSKSYAVLLYHNSELPAIELATATRCPDLKTIREVFGALCNYLGLPAGKGFGVSFSFEIGSFLEKFKLNAVVTNSVLKILEQEEFFTLSDNFFSPSIAEIIASKNTLEAFETSYPEYTPIIKGLLRSYEGIYDQPVIIDEFTLAKFIKTETTKVEKLLRELNEKGIIAYTPRSDLPQIFFLTDRPEASDLFINEKHVAERKKALKKRLTAMLEYAKEENLCRTVFINRYFGGTPIDECGICDICIHKKRKKIASGMIDLLMDQIAIDPGIKFEKLLSITKMKKKEMADIIAFLKDENEIYLNLEGGIFLTKNRTSIK